MRINENIKELGLILYLKLRWMLFWHKILKRKSIPYKSLMNKTTEFSNKKDLIDYLRKL